MTGNGRCSTTPGKKFRRPRWKSGIFLARWRPYVSTLFIPEIRKVTIVFMRCTVGMKNFMGNTHRPYDPQRLFFCHPSRSLHLPPHPRQARYKPSLFHSSVSSNASSSVRRRTDVITGRSTLHDKSEIMQFMKHIVWTHKGDPRRSWDTVGPALSPSATSMHRLHLILRLRLALSDGGFCFTRPPGLVSVLLILFRHC